MAKYLILFIIFINGLIHLMGFAKAFNYGDIKQLTLPISKAAGIFWLITAFLFIISAVLLFMEKDYWRAIVIPAVIISQAIIIVSWKDARWGTIANFIILTAAILSWGSSRFENGWRKDVKENLRGSIAPVAEILAMADIQHLPLPVQRYLQYSGVVGKPKVKNMRVVFDVKMRERKKDFFQAASVQYNFFDEPARLFFMKGKMFGIIVPGYHYYMKGKAVMDIRFYGLFSVVKKKGEVMNKSETVTFFNDMCLMAPAALIDERIQWLASDSNSAKAIFTNHGIRISATLYFNRQGQLINFISEDRSDMADMKEYPWSTPVISYQEINGVKLMKEGDAVWHYPEGKFVYGKFELKQIEYNVTDFK